MEEKNKILKLQSFSTECSTVHAAVYWTVLCSWGFNCITVPLQILSSGWWRYCYPVRQKAEVLPAALTLLSCFLLFIRPKLLKNNANHCGDIWTVMNSYPERPYLWALRVSSSCSTQGTLHILLTYTAGILKVFAFLLPTQFILRRDKQNENGTFYAFISFYRDLWRNLLFIW